MYYVYIFYSDLCPIYVGYGKGQRWKDHFSKRTNLRLNRFLSKNPHVIPKIVAHHLTVSEAKLLERKLIASFGRFDCKQGSLYNLTDGGDGASGLSHSLDSRRKISEGAKRRWADETIRMQHSLTMKLATNSQEFKKRVIERRAPGWLPKPERKKLATAERKRARLEEIKSLIIRGDLEKAKEKAGIQTENGFVRFMKRNNFLKNDL